MSLRRFLITNLARRSPFRIVRNTGRVTEPVSIIFGDKITAHGAGAVPARKPAPAIASVSASVPSFKGRKSPHGLKVPNRQE
jgi:hypothetical protein